METNSLYLYIVIRSRAADIRNLYLKHVFCVCPADRLGQKYTRDDKSFRLIAE